MTRLLRAAAVIARRDFTATVFSRSFLLFLLGPLLALGFGGLIGKVADQSDQAALKPRLVVVATAPDAAPLRQRYARLVHAVEAGALPELSVAAPEGDVRRQLARLTNDRSAVLIGWPAAPHLVGDKATLDRTSGLARLLVTGEGGGATARMVTVATDTTTTRIGGSTGRHLLARLAQTLLFMLTILLAGMLLSNLVEEKSNKVIEVLASAVPVDAIFLGKLVAMLGVSLVGIALWASVLGGGTLALLPPSVTIPVPAVGWPLFIVLCCAYYVTNYMILGGAFLGIGAQAASVREVQTLSMPVTMAQLAVFAVASTSVGDLARPIVAFASIFPLTSPLTMIARAAQEDAPWMHALALLWQALWVSLIIRFAARRFRVGVLKSGPPVERRRLVDRLRLRLHPATK